MWEKAAGGSERVLVSRPEALERFLHGYFDGTLKPYLKSEPLPENNDGPVKVSSAPNTVPPRRDPAGPDG